MSKATPPPFVSPDDFAPVKGRPKHYYCQLCLPAGHSKGQAMSLPAALRHERENAKHLEKVQEKIRNDWNYNPPCDWGPTKVPPGSNAWEESYPADRAEDFIIYWRTNVAAAEREEPLETMDSFIDRFNEKYQDWLTGRYAREAQGAEQERGDREEDESWEEGAWNGVPGLWYEGGSFFPHEDGFNSAYFSPARRPSDNLSRRQKEQTWQPCSPEAATNMWLIPEDPREMYLGWGFKPDEIPMLHTSDATPPSQPQDEAKNGGDRKSAGARQGKNDGNGRGNGGAQKQGGGKVVEGATRRTNARRGQKAKIH